MFDIAEKAVIWLPVPWKVVRPGPDGNAITLDVSVDVEVELKDRDEIIDLAAEMFGIETGKDDETDDEAPKVSWDEAKKIARDDEVKQFMALVSAWRNFKDKGKELPFNAANARKLIAQPGFLSAFQTAYMNALSGKLEIRSGNSKSSPGNGRAGGRRRRT